MSLISIQVIIAPPVSSLTISGKFCRYSAVHTGTPFVAHETEAPLACEEINKIEMQVISADKRIRLKVMIPLDIELKL